MTKPTKILTSPPASPIDDSPPPAPIPARHTCPVPGCTVELDYGTAFCAAHWKRLPKEIQERIVYSWRMIGVYRRHKLPASARTMVAQHREAIEDAVDALKAKTLKAKEKTP